MQPIRAWDFCPGFYTATNINQANGILNEELETESTKLWHLSPLVLYELLEIELQTGKLIFPTEAYF